MITHGGTSVDLCNSINLSHACGELRGVNPVDLGRKCGECGEVRGVNPATRKKRQILYRAGIPPRTSPHSPHPDPADLSLYGEPRIIQKPQRARWSADGGRR